MLPRTLAILLPLAVVAITPLALVLLLSPFLPPERAAYFLALTMASLLTLVVAWVVFAVTSRRLRATPRGNIATADSFIVFAFGLGKNNTAGESNLALARWLMQHNPERKPTIVQEGVYLALQELGTATPLDWVTNLPSPKDVYIDTYGGALQTEVVMMLKGLNRPVLVSHDLQLERMIWTFEALGRTEFIVPDMPATPFDQNSIQHNGTRYQGAWAWRERLAARPITLALKATVVLALVVGVLYVGALLWLFPAAMALAERGRYCTYCGGLFTQLAWPRLCDCGMTTYRNPILVAAVLLPVDGGLLLVRRAIEPAVGELTFPGGYVNEGESWQEAAVRELQEETGISLEVGELKLFDAISSRRGHLVMLYGLAPPQVRHSLPPFTRTEEGAELVILLRPIRLTWEQDTHVAAKFFAAQPHPTSPPDFVPYSR